MNRLLPPVAAAAAAAALLASPAVAQPAPFEDCPAAYRARRSHIPSSDPQYHSRLDRDNDGVACVDPPWGDGPAPTTSAPAPDPTVAPPAAEPEGDARPAVTAPPSTARRSTGVVRATPRYTG